MKKLRLLVTKQCPKKCVGCCNKQWNLEELPIVDNYNYDEIMITGGEPLHGKAIDKTISLINYLKNVDFEINRKIFVYTANPDYLFWNYRYFYRNIDGITLTLHTQKDIKMFEWLNKIVYYDYFTGKQNKSLRLNIFKGVHIPKRIKLDGWIIKKDIEWIKNCPLPKDEVFLRLKNID